MHSTTYDEAGCGCVAAILSHLLGVFGWVDGQGKPVFVCGSGVSITLINGVVETISFDGVCQDVLPLAPMRKTLHG